MEVVKGFNNTYFYILYENNVFRKNTTGIPEPR